MRATEIESGQYQALLETKTAEVESLFNEFNPPSIEVFASEPLHYRMSAEFRIWHDGDDMYHIMFDQSTLQRYRVDEFPITSKLINRMMKALLPLLKTQESWDGKQIVYPAGKAEVTVVQVEVAPGGETGWHLHPVPSFGVVLEGELEVELKSGKTLLLKPGEAAVETVNVLHNGRNIGTVPVKLVVFYAGNTEDSLTINTEVEK